MIFKTKIRPGTRGFGKFWLSSACALAQLTKLVAEVCMCYFVSTCQIHATQDLTELCKKMIWPDNNRCVNIG